MLILNFGLLSFGLDGILQLKPNIRRILLTRFVIGILRIRLSMLRLNIDTSLEWPPRHSWKIPGLFLSVERLNAQNLFTTRPCEITLLKSRSLERLVGKSLLDTPSELDTLERVVCKLVISLSF